MIDKLTGLSHIKLAIATPFYEIKGFSPYIVSLARTIHFLAKYTDVIGSIPGIRTQTELETHLPNGF